MDKPSLESLDYKPEEASAPAMAEEAPAAEVSPGVQAASVVREALEAGDDEALYDAICAIMQMHEGKEEEMEAPAKKAPSLLVALGSKK